MEQTMCIYSIIEEKEKKIALAKYFRLKSVNYFRSTKKILLCFFYSVAVVVVVFIEINIFLYLKIRNKRLF
jgi:hypothetical protein